MWRMYLNEELSRVISAKRYFMDQSNSIERVTSSYTNHPDGSKYGRQMKKIFRSGGDTRTPSFDILPDNMYLVYGLPRVSLHNQIPESVRRLHESTSCLRRSNTENDGRSGDVTEDQISEMFKFVTLGVAESDYADSTNTVSVADNKRQFRLKDNVEVEANGPNEQLQASTFLSNSDVAQNASSKSLVRKDSRFSMTNLPRKQQNSPPETQYHVTPNKDVILPIRSSKDLWRTLRERKPEILQMSRKNKDKTSAKKEQSKTSQLWAFIFSRKKDLIQMKREMRPSSEVSGSAVLTQEVESLSPRDFEDAFQRELQMKLKARAKQSEVHPVTHL